MDDAERAVKAYTGEISGDNVSQGNTYDFNILFANVETIVPAVINSPPAPDIRRRFGDADDAAKDVAELLERAIRVQVDDSRLQTELEKEAHDSFLAGRGVIRLRFKSDFIRDEKDELDAAKQDASPGGTAGDSGSEADEYANRADAPVLQESGREGAPGGAPAEKLANERICFEAVSWRDYRHGPSKRWEDRPWDAFRFVVSREDYGDAFDGELINTQITDQEKKERGESANDLTGWEVWCRKTRQVKFIDDNGVVLRVVPDPLGLKDFFCIGTPVQPIEVNGRLMPVNPFMIYRKLADELDLTTKRIGKITDAMKVKGWYPGDAGDLANMLSADDNEFVGIANADIWAANGGLAGAVAFWPIEKFIVVLKELYVAREQTKQAIYEITGISDIVRGASKANETLGAQQIKTQWGSLRIQKMQRMMERSARDLFVMMAEIIPAKFSRETLQAMTGIQLIPTQEDLTPVRPPQPPQGEQMPPEAQQQAQQVMAQAQQAEQARQTKLANMQKVNQLLQQPLGLMYRIDVESDSTVKADLTRQKAEASEFLQGAATYFQAVGPLVQEGALPKDAAVEIFAANARLFNLGKSVEDTLEKLASDAKEQAGQPPPPSPEEKKAQAEMAMKKQEFDMKAEASKADMASKQQSAQLDSQAKQQDIAAKREMAEIDKQIKVIDLMMKREELAIRKQELAMGIEAKGAETAMKLSAQKQSNEMKAAQAKKQEKANASR